jgi:hypothetical protein
VHEFNVTYEQINLKKYRIFKDFKFEINVTVKKLESDTCLIYLLLINFFVLLKEKAEKKTEAHKIKHIKCTCFENNY